MKSYSCRICGRCISTNYSKQIVRIQTIGLRNSNRSCLSILQWVQSLLSRWFVPGEAHFLSTLSLQQCNQSIWCYQKLCSYDLCCSISGGLMYTSYCKLGDSVPRERKGLDHVYESAVFRHCGLWRYQWLCDLLHIRTELYLGVPKSLPLSDGSVHLCCKICSLPEIEHGPPFLCFLTYVQMWTGPHSRMEMVHYHHGQGVCQDGWRITCSNYGGNRDDPQGHLGQGSRNIVYVQMNC